jgi:hypothetical protein
MGRETELIFIERHSTDDTYASIEMVMVAYPLWRTKLLNQTGMDKGDVVARDSMRRAVTF